MSKMHSAKKLVIDFILVMLGNAIMALGTAGFAVPAKIILGGVSGLALAFQHYVFYVHLSTLVLVINIIAFIAGYLLLGKKFAVGTLVSTFAFPFFLAIFEKSYYLTHLTKDTLLAAVRKLYADRHQYIINMEKSEQQDSIDKIMNLIKDNSK